MTPHWRAWLWLCCLLLITITNTDYTNIFEKISNTGATKIFDKIASRLSERVRFWSKTVPSEGVSASMNVPSQDVSVSMVDDAAVVDGSVKSDDIAECSEDGTCDTGDLYDGDEGEKVEEHVSASTADTEVGRRIVELDDIVDTGDLHNEDEDEEDGDYEEEWGDVEDEEECVDNNEKCDEWASMGECEANPRYMLINCKKSCMICGDM